MQPAPQPFLRQDLSDLYSSTKYGINIIRKWTSEIARNNVGKVPGEVSNWGFQNGIRNPVATAEPFNEQIKAKREDSCLAASHVRTTLVLATVTCA